MKTILIVAAHTDDEALGCGGTIARHVSEGDSVSAIFIADGVSSRSEANYQDQVKRNSAAEQARKILGIKENIYINLPDNRLDSIPLIEIIKRIETVIQKLAPNIIYTHHYGDLNVDHRITHQAVLTACRPIPQSSVSEIYAFEVMSSTEWASPLAEPFVPNHFVDISGYLDAKLEALRAYQVEMRQSPHSRCVQNIKSLATYRGHAVGRSAAEAFVTLRTIW